MCSILFNLSLVQAILEFYEEEMAKITASCGLMDDILFRLCYQSNFCRLQDLHAIIRLPSQKFEVEVAFLCH
jgi:hypothetical protein